MFDVLFLCPHGVLVCTGTMSYQSLFPLQRLHNFISSFSHKHSTPHIPTLHTGKKSFGKAAADVLNIAVDFAENISGLPPAPGSGGGGGTSGSNAVSGIFGVFCIGPCSGVVRIMLCSCGACVRTAGVNSANRFLLIFSLTLPAYIILFSLAEPEPAALHGGPAAHQTAAGTHSGMHFICLYMYVTARYMRICCNKHAYVMDFEDSLPLTYRRYCAPLTLLPFFVTFSRHSTPPTSLHLPLHLSPSLIKVLAESTAASSPTVNLQASSTYRLLCFIAGGLSDDRVCAELLQPVSVVLCMLVLFDAGNLCFFHHSQPQLH